MEVTSTIKEEEVPKLNVDIDDIGVKESQTEHLETEKEKSPIEGDVPPPANSNIDYDDEEDSGDDFAVITKTSTGVDSSPAKNLFSIKTISNAQIQSNYKISKTAIDLEHPGNVNGVPTVDYDLSKLTDDCKPWKKPGADVSDFFNYGFTEETWLLYCEKQKALRMTQDNSALKTLSGLTNFGYNLSGSHIHMNFNRNNPKMNKGGIIDVIGSCQQNGDYKNKQHEMGMSNKISTIPVQTGHMNMMGQNNQPGMNSNNSYMTGLANQALNNNLLNPLMMAMGMIPNTGQVNLLNTGQNMPIDVKMSQYGGGGSMDTGGGGGSRNYGHNNWANNNNNNTTNNNNNNNNNSQDYDRHNSVDSMHSHEEYGDKKSSFIKSDRGTRRNEHDESHRYRSRDKREKSPEKRRRSRSRERGHDSKYSRSSKRNRSPEDSRRHKKYSRERSKDRGGSSDNDSSKRHRGHRSSKKTHRQSRSRSRSNADSRKERRHRHKSVHDESGKVSSGGKQGGSKEDAEGHGAERVDNSIKREKETSRGAD